MRARVWRGYSASSPRASSCRAMTCCSCTSAAHRSYTLMLLCLRRHKPQLGDLCAGGHFPLSIIALASLVRAIWLDVLLPAHPASGWLGCDRQGALEVVGDGGEEDLGVGLGYTPPSYAPEAATSFPCPEDLLNPTTHLMDRAVMGLEPGECFLLIASPHGNGHDARYSALGAQCLCKDLASAKTWPR